MSTYSLTYDFEDMPLLGTGAGHVTGRVFVAVDPVTTDYFIEQLFLDDEKVPFDHLLWDLVATQLRETRDEQIRALAATIEFGEDRGVASRALGPKLVTVAGGEVSCLLLRPARPARYVSPALSVQ